MGRQQGSGCRGGARGRPATTGPPPPRLGGAERSGGLAAASPHRPELQLRLQPQKRCLRQCRTRLAPPAAAEPLAQSTPRRPAGSGLGASLAGGPAGQGPPQLGGGGEGQQGICHPRPRCWRRHLLRTQQHAAAAAAAAAQPAEPSQPSPGWVGSPNCAPKAVDAGAGAGPAGLVLQQLAPAADSSSPSPSPTRPGHCSGGPAPIRCSIHTRQRHPPHGRWACWWPAAAVAGRGHFQCPC